MHCCKRAFFVVLSTGLLATLLHVRAETLREPIGQSSRLTSLVISEIMYHPAKRSDGKALQFVELYNALSTAEDLTGYRLSGDVDYSFPAGTIIPPGGYLVVAQNPAQLQEVYGIAGALGPFEAGAALPHDTGTVRLRNRLNAIFLEVSYSNDREWPVAADGAGHSLVLARPSLGERDPSAWAASDRIGGSPGGPEPAGTEPEREVLINELLAHTDDPELDYIELYNHSNEAVDLSGCVLSDDPATNKFVLPPATSIPARGFLVFNQNQLGFALSALGEAVYLKNADQTRVLDAVRFDGQENGISIGRVPDGASRWSRLVQKTPGEPNGAIRVSPVVLNEIMYHPISGDDDAQYVELYNRGAEPVDLAGWQLGSGIEFTFAAGTVLPPGSFLVVARNREQFRTQYPNVAESLVTGDFKGRLAGSGERITLTKPDTVLTTNLTGQVETNLIHIVVDEVDYRDGGRWGHWADGGGSSLERIDARADGRNPSNWADSDESGKAPWTEVSATGRLDNGNVSADQLQVLLQGTGECLIDDVEVIDANGVNQVANSTFESNASGWTAEGTEEQSGWETGEGFNSAHSYHVRATDRGDNQVNRIRTPLRTPLSAGSTATIRAKVRWIKGAPTVLFRLRGNWLEAVGRMNLPVSAGTPGAQNSRALVNAPPALYEVAHAPAVPAAEQAVLVTARASDPDGLAQMQLNYRVDPNPTYTSVTMNDAGSGGDAVAGDGTYSATIPGQGNGALVAYYIEASDSTQTGTGTYPDDAPNEEALVRFGEPTPAGTLPVYRIWMTQSTLNTWVRRSKLNNNPLPVTFVLGNSRVIQNARAVFAGSPYIAPGYDSPTGRRCGYSVSFPADDRFLGDTDLVLDWPGGHGNENTALQEQMAYWMADQMGLPYSHRYYIRLQVNGITDMQRRTVFEAVNQPAGDFIRAWVPNDSDGDFYKIDRAFEFNDGGGVIADPQPRLENYTTTGGAKKTARYRWNWLKRSTTDVNDYTNIFQLVDALNASRPEPYTSQTEALVDIEEWLGILALEHIIVNFDAYGHEIGKNMYAYKPESGRWQLYMFDLDWLMLAAAGRGGNYSPNRAVLFNSEDPIMAQMYQFPPFRRAYFRAVKKAVDGPMLSANCDPVMDAKYQALVANGVTLCDGETLAPPTAVKNWFSQRRAYLVNQLNTVAAEFAITSNGGSDFSTNTTLVTLTGTAPVEVKTIRVNGTEYPVTWTSVREWALRLPLPEGEHALHFEGISADGTPLTNLTDQITVTTHFVAESPLGKVIINEILYRPTVEGAEFVELLNTSPSSSFDLSGWRLNGVDYTFPAGSFIAPGGYIVLTKDRGAFASAYGNTIPITGEFAGKLDPDGETLSLIVPGANGNAAQVVDSVTYGAEQPWPVTTPGASLQLVDPEQENFRVGNWQVMADPGDPGASPQWQYVTATGTASSSRLYLYLGSAGDVFLDDLQLVAGEQPGAGQNFIANGGFESDLSGPWNVTATTSGSSISTAVRHSGQRSLHLVASGPGSSQGSSIWQDLGPLVSGDTYTLSYWYLPSANGSGLTIRLSGSGISSSHSINPNETPVLLSTPGAANSVSRTLAEFPPVWINEVDPAGTTATPGAIPAPWLELYNSGASDVALNGWSLANNFTNLTQWTFPPGAQIRSHEYLLVWLDGTGITDSTGAWHASFRPEPGNGAIVLAAPRDGQTAVLDYVRYGFVSAGSALGLFPDGVGGPRRSLSSPTPGQANDNGPAPAPALFINEWMAANTSTLIDPADGHFDDWFELFNPSDAPIDLAGYWLSDSLTNTTARWKVPAGVTIPARGYTLVWADNDTDQNSTDSVGLHAGFRLSQEGETIALFAPDGRLIDAVEFGAQLPDQSQGRFPDGSTNMMALPTPTPGASNSGDVDASPRLLPMVLSSAGEINLSWTAEAGRTYRVQVRNDLVASPWTDVADVRAESSEGNFRITLTGATQAYYRVVLLPR